MGLKDSAEKEIETHCVFWAWKIPWTKELAGTVHGVTRVVIWLSWINQHLKKVNVVWYIYIYILSGVASSWWEKIYFTKINNLYIYGCKYKYLMVKRIMEEVIFIWWIYLLRKTWFEHFQVRLKYVKTEKKTVKQSCTGKLILLDRFCCKQVRRGQNLGVNQI